MALEVRFTDRITGETQIHPPETFEGGEKTLDLGEGSEVLIECRDTCILFIDFPENLQVCNLKLIIEKGQVREAQVCSKTTVGMNFERIVRGYGLKFDCPKGVLEVWYY